MAEDDDNTEATKPLSASEFRDALLAVASLGLTWTADRIPRLTAKSQEAEGAFASKEYERLESTYPDLPRELSAVVYHALTGAPASEHIAGTPEELREKVAVVRDLLLTPSYRSEFFFRYALKVPYFESIDWEVVFKTHERNVAGMPAVGYALLLLTFHNTNNSVSRINEHLNMTVAVDLPLVNKLLVSLTNIKEALEQVNEFSGKIAEAEAKRIEDQTDAREN